MSKCKRVVVALFDLFMNEPNTLPTPWQEEIRAAGGDTDRNVLARAVADYIAGMTDRYALAEYGRLFDMDAKT
jgi:dGTPase